MSYAIFRTEKMQSTVLDKCQRHNQRENRSYSNQDIDLNKSKLNYDLHNSKNINYRDEINKKIKDRYKGKRTIRKDAVLNIECLITSDTDFFNRIGEYETERYFREAYEFVKTEFGEENINYATVHMDETTPHMHLGVTPLTKDGRLNAKTWLNGKKKLTEMQNRFHKHMTDKGFEVERGISSKETKAKNKRIAELKKESLKELEQIKKEIQIARNELNNMSDALYQSSLELDTIDYETISKSDFEKLKITAINASKIQNAFNKKIEFLEKENKELKDKNETLAKEKDIYKNGRSSSAKMYNNTFEKLKEDYKINTLRKDLLIKDMTQFLKNKRMYIDFEIYKEDMLNKRIELAEQQKSRNKSKVSKSITDKGLEL
mgnify:CR=1 FL=1|jgi:hypothetical protein